MARIGDRMKLFITDFIEVYRNLPALWDTNSKDYTNRAKKKIQYDELIMKYREKFPDADKPEVVQKINSLRTNYRKELKRLRDAKLNGEHAEPSLWYFDQMRFLQSVLSEFCPARNPLTPDVDDETLDYASESSDHSVIDKPQVPHPPQNNRKRKLSRDIEVLAKRVAKDLQSAQDDDDKIASVWAVELRKMDPQQQLFAKKAVSEILFEGQMGTLHRYSVEINASPKNNVKIEMDPECQNAARQLPHNCPVI